MLEIRIRIKHRVAYRRMLAVKGMGFKTLNGVPVNYFCHIIIIKNLYFLQLMGGAEAVEEMLEGNTRAYCRQVSDSSQIHTLLNA